MQHDALDGMDDEQLAHLRDELTATCEEISIKLMTANEKREHGGQVDEDWFHRACCAKAHYKKQLKAVQREIDRRSGKFAGVDAQAARRSARDEAISKLSKLMDAYKGEVRRDTIQRCIDAVLEVNCG